jgi:hypothetical protein
MMGGRNATSRAQRGKAGPGEGVAARLVIEHMFHAETAP